MRAVKMKHGVVGALIAGCLGGTAAAQDRGVVFGGGEAGEDASGYFGVVWAAPGSQLGRGWAVRGLASIGQYDYQGGPGRVNAEFIQADLAVLRQSSGTWGYANFGVGVRVTDTDLDPADPGNARDGNHWDGIVTADGVREVGAWRIGGYGVYGVRMREYYLRGEVTRRIGSGGLRAGVEALTEGDESYDRSGGGGVLAYETADGVGVRAAVGARDDGDGYVSIGLTRTF